MSPLWGGWSPAILHLADLMARLVDNNTIFVEKRHSSVPNVMKRFTYPPM